VTQAIRNAEWFTWFPEDYRWSFNMQLVVESARTGGADIGEIDRVARRMAGHIGDDEVWFTEWERMADHVRGLAEDAQAAGRRLSAAAHFRRACMYYFTAEHFRFPKDSRALEAYRKCVDTFHEFAANRPDLGIEFVDIPYDNRQPLAGYFVPARPTAKSGNGKPPVVVFFNGFDGNKEFNWYLGIEDLTARGISVLSVDSPGTGESVRFRENYLRHDYEVAGGACIDYLETRGDVDAARVGIMALSLGGYYATRSASMEHRFKACVAWGAIWDYHAIWRKRYEAAFQLALPVPGEHLQWSTNADSPEGALAAIEGFKLDGVVQQMRCPYLLVHGEDDQQVPLADAEKLFAACGSEDKTLRVFSNEEGGAQHCHTDNLSIATPVIFDWLADRLGGSVA
jgi:dienelactone hydrolase